MPNFRAVRKLLNSRSGKLAPQRVVLDERANDHSPMLSTYASNPGITSALIPTPFITVIATSSGVTVSE